MSLSSFSDSYCRTLERIVSICKDRHTYLRTCCMFVLSELKKDASLEHMSPEEKANMVFYPLKIAAETREEPFVLLAVDSIQKLVAHGLVDGSFVYKSPDVPLPPKKKSFFAFGGSDTPPSQTPKNDKEESVSMMKVLLGMVCMNASLSSEEVQLIVVRTLLTAVSTARCEVHASNLMLCVRTTCDVYLQAKVLPSQTSAKAALSQMIGTVLLKLESEAPNEPLNTSGGDVPLRGGGGGGDTNDVDEERATVSSNDTAGAGGDGGTSAEHADDSISFGSVNERDCFLILRSLCKLSSKNCDGAPLDSVEMRSKTLSLHLLYNLVSSMGPNFASKPSWSIAMHKYLCGSLLHNFTSGVAEVTKLSANILLQLLLEHRHKMGSKIAVFFVNVIFPILESPNSSFAHRSAVLTLLQKLFADGQAMTDIFVNFDCKLNSPNLYHQLVNRVARVVQTTHVVPNWISPAQDVALKLLAARAVTSHVTALRKWIAVQHEVAREAEQERRDEQPDASGREDETSPAAAATTTTTGTAEFERMLKGKKTFETVLDVFNKRKAKEGIALALEAGLIAEQTPSEVAQFLLTKGLDKVKVGEYLSQNNPFVKDTLKAFIEMNDFEGLEIDEAMRVFLGKFKIFGEAEVVDRTMELFAERYCEQNPHAFSSAGTAYILAFSIMMLNTDAHSVHVKSKMTLAEFIRNNRGIDDGKDLPDDLMRSIYQRITTNEIKLEGDAASPTEVGSPGKAAVPVSEAKKEDTDIFTSLEKKKQMSYKTETALLMQQSMQLLCANADEDAFSTAAGTRVASAMWECAWTPVLPAISVPMEESSDEEIVDCCLEGFDSAMSINCYFALATERKAFISSLLAFTHLTSFREIYYKNVKSIMTVIKVATREGNALESSWYEILRCISWLDKLHLLSDAQHTKADGLRGIDAGQVQRRDVMSQRAVEFKKVELHNAEIISSSIDQVQVDRIFSKSGELEGRAVVDLVEALCKVSVEELQEQPRPRTYSLQKLVEVAEINIGRLRYVWSQMWHHLSKHFINVGMDRQQLVAMFVVDSLRQLAFKFLQRDELGNFNFQRDFLKPFEVIAAQSKRPDIHELIIASLGQMVEARAKNIMSGWKIVLNTIGRFGLDTHRSVVVAASDVLRRISVEHVRYLATPELVTEAINAWSMFGANTVSVDLAIESIKFIHVFSHYVAHGVPQFAVPRDSETTRESNGGKAVQQTSVDELLAALSTTNEKPPEHPSLVAAKLPDGTVYDFKSWISTFAALSSLTGVPDAAIRSFAVRTLFSILEARGGMFSEQDWQMILGGAVFPIFENLLCDIGSNSAAASNTQETQFLSDPDRRSQLELLRFSMRSTVDLHTRHYAILGPHVGDLMDAFAHCGLKADKEVVRLGFFMLVELITSVEKAGLADPVFFHLFEGRLRSIMDDVLAQIRETFERPAGTSLAPTQQTVSLFSSLTALCGCTGAIVDTVQGLPAGVLSSFAAIFRDMLHACIEYVDADSEYLLHDELAATQALLSAEGAACDGYINCFPHLASTEEKQLFFTTGAEMFGRVLCSDGAEGGNHIRQEEAAMMAGVATELLTTSSSMTEEDFEVFLDYCYRDICHLLPVCHPDVNHAVVGVLLRARPQRL